MATSFTSWFREHTPNVPALLADVRRRPGCWMPRRNIHFLNMMLAGIDFAEEFHGVPAEARFGGFDFAAFEAWVERTYNPQRLTCRSFGLAAELAGSEGEEAFDLWFR